MNKKKMDHSACIVCSFMENSICLKLVKMHDPAHENLVFLAYAIIEDFGKPVQKHDLAKAITYCMIGSKVSGKLVSQG